MAVRLKPSSSRSEATTCASSMALRLRAGEFAASIEAFKAKPETPSTMTGISERPSFLQRAKRLKPSMIS